jgi:hypothetical protein
MMIPNVMLPGARERTDVRKDEDKELGYNGEFCK